MKRRLVLILIALVLFGTMIVPVAAAATATPELPLRNWTSQRYSGITRHFSQRHISWRATTHAPREGANGLNFSVALVRGNVHDEAAEGFQNVRRNGTSQIGFNDVGAGWYHFRYQRNSPGDGIAINSIGNVLMRSSIVTWPTEGDIVW